MPQSAFDQVFSGHGRRGVIIQTDGGHFIKVVAPRTGNQVPTVHFDVRVHLSSNAADYGSVAIGPVMGAARHAPHIFVKNPGALQNSLSDGGVEGKDVFKNSKTGTTTSKFYHATPIIDGGVHGVTGDGTGCFMNMGNRETSSGGPFFRDIENQSGGGATEFYNYMYSGHTQTEAFRPSLKGPYALQFTDGTPPATPDYSFIEKLSLKGCVPGQSHMTRWVTSSRLLPLSVADNLKWQRKSVR